MRLDRVEYMGLAAGIAVAIAVGLAFAFAEATAALLVAILAIQSFGLLIIRRWICQRDRLFIHGYHAGWHMATLEGCPYPEHCQVLDLAERRRRKV